MQITVINVANQTVPTNKGSYQKLEVSYKDDQGKTATRPIMDFVKESKPAFTALVDAQYGDVFNIDMVKQPGRDGKEYWVWTNATKGAAGAKSQQGGTPSASTGSGTVAKGNWETAEERAARQVYIIRQSSIANAVAALSVGVKAPPKSEEILVLAKKFEDFVFKGLTGDTVADLTALEDPQEFTEANDPF